jgi:hypothetical protein
MRGISAGQNLSAYLNRKSGSSYSFVRNVLDVKASFVRSRFYIDGLFVVRKKRFSLSLKALSV